LQKGFFASFTLWFNNSSTALTRGDMKRRMFVGSIAAGFLASKTLSQNSPQTEFSGVINGYVLNEEGRPVGKADVYAQPTKAAWAGRLPSGRSDSSGRFTIHVWHPTEYAVTAVKEKDGYPDTYNSFYGPPTVTWPIVTIGEWQTHHEVTVYLGPSLGRLTGKILDAETAQPIEIVRMNLHHLNNPEKFISRGAEYPKGRYRLLVPVVPVKFKISVPGYQEWWYGADGSEERAEALQIEPGSTRELTIRLRPAKGIAK
jgi:hypothetical protein